MDQIKGLNAFLSGDLDTAERLTNDALQTVIQIYGPDHLATTEMQQVLATILVAKEEMIEAYDDFDAVRQTVFNYVQHTLADLPVREQAAFLRVQDKRQLDRALSIAFRPGANSIDASFSATWALNTRNLPHELSARSSQIRRLLTKPAEKNAYDQFLAARQRLATIPVGANDPAEQQFRTDEIASQKDIVAKSLKTLSQEVRQQIEQQNSEWIEIETLQKTLAADETLIEIVRMRPLSFSPDKILEEANPKFQPTEEYVAWIVPPRDAGDIKVVRLGDAERIDELVLQVFNEFQRSFLRIGQDGHRNATESALDSCKALSDVVWNPIQQQLATRTKVILSPDGELWRAPWSTLPIGEDRLLLDDFEVRLVVTGRELLRTSKNSLSLSAPLIIADPDYDASDNAIRDALNNVPLSVPRPTEREADPETAPLRATLPHRALRLPGTAREARDVANDVKQMASQDPRVCLQALASEEVFRRSRRPYSVMFSTHGFFVPLTSENATTSSTSVAGEFGDSSDPLLRCRLLLAGCNLKENKDSISDGILLGREIVETDLRGTTLVVLSACETGLGDIADGEGIAGMRQAFQLAGAESVVSRLWSIDDDETAKLMKEFFAGLSAGKTKSAALRQA
jgi:CHAT domain-containing protein